MTIVVSKGTHHTAAGWSADAAPGRLPARLEVLATMARADMGATLYSPGDAADSWYRLITGAACEYVQTADGRRQILDFLLPGDLFGFCSRQQHEFSVEILADDTAFARYPRQRVEELAAVDTQIARALRLRAFESISRLQARTVLLGRTNALEKVSAFLLDMTDRTSLGAANDLILPMSRYDIADYLAMAVETVSRALTTLRARGAITLANSRQVRITDRRALEALRNPQHRPVAARQRTYAQPSAPARQEMPLTSSS